MAAAHCRSVHPKYVGGIKEINWVVCFSEDIMRVLKCLSPVLNVSFHVRKPTRVKQDTQLSGTGPLTWRQFHRMAGVTIKV